MSTKPKVMITERLSAAHLVISNSLEDAEVQSLVAPYGYTAEALKEGMALYEQALAAERAQGEAAGAQQDATHASLAAEVAARDAYQALAKVARAVFQSDRPRLVALGLQGSEPDSNPSFLARALILFDSAAQVPDLAARGYSPAQLKQQRGLIEAFQLADEAQEKAKGIAQQATQTRDAVLERLDAWRAQFVKIARVALRGNRQMLERLGVPARTSKTRAERSRSAAAQQAASNRRRPKAAARKRTTEDKPLAV